MYPRLGNCPLILPGMIASITKAVPKTAVSAITPMFSHLCNKPSTPVTLDPEEFDWAIHPGGTAILQGAQQTLHLTDDHIRASLDIYSTYGNSSSPTVLIVLDQLRRMGQGRDNVVAASFGPGISIEMFLMKRCRNVPVAPPMSTSVSGGKRNKFWLGLQSWMTRVGKKSELAQGVKRYSVVQ